MTNRMILNETSYFGKGAIQHIPEEVTKRQLKKALIVTDKGYYSGKGDGYQLKRLGNAYCSFSFIPIDIRNEYQITQYLENRK